MRGEVEPDRYVIAKNGLSVLDEQVGSKAIAYLFDADIGEVRSTERAPSDRSALDASEIRELARLGTEVETAFGRPVDIEWAVDGDRRLQFVQARPETVWSRRPSRHDVETVIGRVDGWDPLNYISPSGVHWRRRTA